MATSPETSTQSGKQGKDRGKPPMRNALRECLEHLANRVFGPDYRDEEDRGTIFKARERWVCHGYKLKSYVRTGRHHQNTKQKFVVPDNPNTPKARDIMGLVGWAWVIKEPVIVSGLPDITSTPSEREIAEYAEKTFLSKRRVKKGKYQARSYYAIYLKNHKNHPWGVLVLDSRKTDRFHSIAEPLLREFQDKVGVALSNA